MYSTEKQYENFSPVKTTYDLYIRSCSIDELLNEIEKKVRRGKLSTHSVHGNERLSRWMGVKTLHAPRISNKLSSSTNFIIIFPTPHPFFLIYRSFARVSNSDCSLMFGAQVRRTEKKSCETKEVKLIIKSMNIRKQEKEEESFLCFLGGRLMRERSWLIFSCLCCVLPHLELSELAQTLTLSAFVDNKPFASLKFAPSISLAQNFLPLIN